VKREFPLQDDLLYINAANICPASRPVLDRYSDSLRDFQTNPSFQNREKFKTIQERVRGKLARLLQADADEIAVTRNTSEGNNIVVTGLDLKPGDEVIITDHNHPSNNQAWQVRAKREGFTIKSLPVAVPAPSREHLIGAYENAITPRTRVVAITHVTSTTGILYPAREIADLARKRDIWVHLDGAQTFGVLDVNLKQLGCDSYTGSAHKWLMGPLEAGVLYVRAERLPNVWPAIVTAGWADDLKGARKLEIVGQRDDAKVAALEAALDFIDLIGIRNIEARALTLAARIKRQLSDVPGVQLKTNVEPTLSAAVVKFKLKNRPTKEAYDALWQKHRIALALTPAGDAEGLRYSPHIYNSNEEIDRAVAAVKDIAG
jgi:isopenicillin-N epimerase